MKVKVFKMINGEEIIGEVFNQYDRDIELKNPAQIMLQRTEQGMGVALMPYMPYCDGNISFNKHSIVATGEPSKNMINEYNRIFGAGIQVAPASALAGLSIVS